MKSIKEFLRCVGYDLIGLFGTILALLISAASMIITGSLIIGVICLPFVGLFYLCKFLLG